MTRRRARRVAILVAALWGTGCQPSTEALAPEAPGDKAAPGGDVDSGGWELVWSDEFESPAGTSPDASRWGFDIGGTGWGNAEHQYYTDRVENVATDGEGHLVITAREETVPGSSCWNGPCRYSSARLKTQGRFEPQYGRIEMRAQLPFGQGIWPAFWMLGANLGSVGWPASGEIDIMENIGREPSQVHGTLHGPGYSGGEGVGAGYSLPAGQRFADDFHTFAIEWAPDSIRWFVDGKPYQTLTPANLPAGAPWVFDRPFSLLLNLAVGGQWPGVPDPTTTFPQRMRVDYVRVYERGEASGAALETEDDATPFFGPREIVVLEELAPLMTNVFGRKTLSLNGDWAYIVDQLRIGDVSPLLRGGVGEDEVARPGELLEYAFDPARTLRVPGDWNSQDPSLFWYRGVVWYRTEFDYRLPEGKRAYLYFGGGNFAKDVYLNGKLIARHRGGFTPFNSDVTEYLEPGRNRLVVKVDSLSEPTDVPTEYNDWLNYGGLTREVLLVEVPRTFVREYSVQLSRERDAIEGWVQLDGPDAGQGGTLRIEGLGIEERLETGDDGRANFHVLARPELWAPGSPTRYAVSIESGEDRVGEPIGFRSIETRGEDILLNGEPVFLRGIST
ncbi:MAG: family 16 glycosylhydrolase, partial [Myxococcales bacterium]|nr:family 16 glycosylhydrolase [Myxococcales bacterium]